MFLHLIGLLSCLAACLSQEFPFPPRPSADQCSFALDESNSSPLDCFFERQANEEECLARGCCWHVTPTFGRPFCYYPENFSAFVGRNDTPILERLYRSPFPNDVKNVRMENGGSLSDRHFAVRFSDADNERWRPPYPKLNGDTWGKHSLSSEYQVKLHDGDQLLRITRGSRSLLGAESLILADQFIQLTFNFDDKFTWYGLGEHRTRLTLDDNWTKYTMWNHDGVPANNANLYGSHPFVMGVISGTSHTVGIYFHNSNAIEVILQPKSRITFRSIGGLLEFHLLFGDTPAEAVSLYTQLVGLPAVPPYWGLGFQLCRWGYGNTANLRAVWQRMRDNQIPYDVQWNDIDYMRQQTDFTIDMDNFADLPKFVDELHAAGMHYVAMLDPGVSGSEVVEYPPFTDGIEMDVFVKDNKGDLFLGHVWNPNITVFPDFTHPRALEYWTKQLREFRDVMKYDAIWLDMNEPSNFLDGGFNGCPESPLESPPYTPPVVGGKLQSGTMCLSNQHAIGSHYNVHNMYGIAEADVTRRALEDIIGKRTYVISRASFAGLGRYAGHWAGDNNSSWSEMVASIVELLTFSIYGVPYMGSDICGFGGNAERELCNRWTQLGAFYTFSRNHNIIGTTDQDPASFDEEVTASIRKALYYRYLLLPYLYTLFYEAQVSGATVARPLFFEFPDDEEALKVDRAFLWGSGLYIVPVLDQGATSVNAYLPNSRWFKLDRDYDSIKEINEKGSVTLDAPFDTIPLLLRGGSIIPTQAPKNTTTESRKMPVEFLVVPDAEGKASGKLFWDDGESLNPVDNGNYGLLELSLSDRKIQSSVRQWKTDPLQISSVVVFDIKSANQVTVNGRPGQYEIKENVMVVQLDSAVASEPFEIVWM